MTLRDGGAAQPELTRFMAKIDQRGVDECWPWRGWGAHGWGYGLFEIDGRAYTAHRLMYELAVGSVPVGLDVCHTCDNPPCCNPAHLFLGTRHENMQDAVRKGRVAVGQRNGAAKLRDDDIPAIRSMLARGVPTTEIAAMFTVSPSAIRHIAKGRKWQTI